MKKIIRNNRIDFGQAKMFSELLDSLSCKFDTDVRYRYDSMKDELYITDGVVNNRIKRFKKVIECDAEYVAPRLDDVREWFTKHGIVINVDYKKNEHYVCSIYFKDRAGDEICTYNMTYENEIIRYSSYYDALSAGISRVLEMKMVVI